MFKKLLGRDKETELDNKDYLFDYSLLNNFTKDIIKDLKKIFKKKN